MSYFEARDLDEYLRDANQDIREESISEKETIGAEIEAFYKEYSRMKENNCE